MVFSGSSMWTFTTIFTSSLPFFYFNVPVTTNEDSSHRKWSQWIFSLICFRNQYSFSMWIIKCRHDTVILSRRFYWCEFERNPEYLEGKHWNIRLGILRIIWIFTLASWRNCLHITLMLVTPTLPVTSARFLGCTCINFLSDMTVSVGVHLCYCVILRRKLPHGRRPRFGFGLLRHRASQYDSEATATKIVLIQNNIRVNIIFLCWGI